MKGEVDNLSGTLGSRLAESQEALTKALGGAVHRSPPKAKSKESVSEETTARAKEAARDVRHRGRAASAVTQRERSWPVAPVANRPPQSLMNSAWLIPLFLVLALFLATLTARSLVKPINQLVGATQALAAYGQQADQRPGDDELARLAGAFNNMAVAIETGQAALQQSNDHLSKEGAHRRHRRLDPGRPGDARAGRPGRRS